MSRRDSLWRALRDLIVGDPQRKLREAAENAIKAHARSAANLKEQAELRNYYEDEALRIDPRVDWHYFAELMDKVVESNMAWDKARIEFNRTADKANDAHNALTRMDNDDAPAAPTFIGNFVSNGEFDASTARHALDEFDARLAQAFGVPAHLQRDESAVGAGDFGAAARG